MKLNPIVEKVTERVRERSVETRKAYLQHLDAMAQRKPGAARMGCANVAHAFAALPDHDKFRVVAEHAPNVGIITAYNDMLSAHAPFQHYPDIIKAEARKQGATAQVAGGVPAMCDGITQGQPGMELSLFSRDVIAMSTAISLSHDVFDAALMLGVCDKIVPGLLIGALHYGHLPTVFVPAGPMTTGLSNSAKSHMRVLAAEGKVGRAELLEAESKAYHGPGTCTFYGTANSNQMMLEAMGLHVPGTAFVNPGSEFRDELTREAVRTVLGSIRDRNFTPIGRVVDERCIVNAMVALLGTGGSTNHLIHWVAVARAAGISINWDDFCELSNVVPLIARVYPNGEADVNAFQAAGGPGYVIRELLDAGLMHEDVLTVRPNGIREYTGIPEPDGDGGNVATYQAVSGTGKEAIEELATQTANLLNAKPVQASVYPKQIAFNVLPQIDVFMDNGYTKEEMKMVWETQKIMGDADILVNPTAVRVPVFFGHSEAVHIETRQKISVARVRELLEAASGVTVIDERENGGYPTAVTDSSGHDDVYVGRIREDISHPTGINLWVVGDNVRKGAALNSVQIAEVLVKNYI